MIGQTIYHYKILEKLGEGGMGVVYKAQDTKLDRFVALKFLPRNFSEDTEQKARFIQEAKAASAIDHPNIASVYEINETSEGHLYIAMGYYEGETLAARIAKGPLSIHDVIGLTLQVAHGLAKAHERGIIHRDLKPANVLITSDGTAKIIDFGLAKFSGGTRLTRTGTSMGTVAYMSPEQASGWEISQTTDIWSLGVMMYEMVTGTLPFKGEYEPAMLYCIVNAEPEPINKLRPDVPNDLEALVEKAIKKEPRNRFQQMGELISALTVLQKIIESGIATDTSKQLASRLLHSIVTKHRVPIWIISAILVVAVIALIFMKQHPNGSSLMNRSIAVLSFTNLGDSSKEYFAYGLTNDIYSGLSRIRDMRVISSQQTVSRYLKGGTYSDSSVISQLGVHFLLKGEVNISPVHGTVRMHLFDTEKSSDVWEESYTIGQEDSTNLRASILKDVANFFHIEYPAETIGTQRPTTEVYEWYLRGMYLRDKITKEDNTLAIKYLSEALNKDSLYIPALLALASGEVEQFRQAWDKSPTLLINAERLCKQIILLDSTRMQAYAILGNIADSRGNRDEALHLLQKAIAKEPHNLYAVTSIVLLYLTEMNDPGKSIVYLESLNEIEPTDWVTVCNLGVAYAQIKNLTKAKQTFRRAMELNPNHEWPPYSLGYTCERLGELDSACTYYEAALLKNPRSTRTYTALASVLLAEGRLVTAESVLTAGMKNLQSDPEFLYVLGVTYRLGGKKSEATQIFQEGLGLIESKISKNPGVGDNSALTGLFQARLGNTSKALALAAEAIRLDSTNEEVLMKVTRLYSVLGNKEKMLKLFARTKAMNPEYDLAYLVTAMDFENYRNDINLLAIARQN
jgi:serine/threonine protein kinase/tetratricopeptide (TPR) repeat protein